MKIKEELYMPKPKWQNFSDNEIKDMVSNSKSFMQLLDKMGYNKTSGSARNSVKNMLEQKQINYSHFYHNNNKEKTPKDIISSPLTLKRKLIEKRGHQCERCYNTKWLNFPITLELHHKNGNHYDNSEDNLELLCPNCHSYTKNWKGKNHKNNKISNEVFLQALKNTDNIHQACLMVGITPCQSSYERARKLLENSP